MRVGTLIRPAWSVFEQMVEGKTRRRHASSTKAGRVCYLDHWSAKAGCTSSWPSSVPPHDIHYHCCCSALTFVCFVLHRARCLLLHTPLPHPHVRAASPTDADLCRQGEWGLPGSWDSQEGDELVHLVGSSSPEDTWSQDGTPAAVHRCRGSSGQVCHADCSEVQRPGKGGPYSRTRARGESAGSQGWEQQQPPAQTTPGNSDGGQGRQG